MRLPQAWPNSLGTGRFSALMELYERNYMQVRLLAPALREFSGTVIARSESGHLPVLHLRDLRHDRYTTTFKLGYRHSRAEAAGHDPDFQVRLYHDAQVCEVIYGLLNEGTAQPRRTRELDSAWRLNAFLQSWLRHLLEAGYRLERENIIAPEQEFDQRQKRSMLSW